MSLIAKVGRRSPGVRSLLIAMYLLLSLGAFTMLYPFALMLTMGTCSTADYEEFKLIPDYWFSDAALFKKYLVDAAPRNNINELIVWFGRDDWFSYRDIDAEDLQPILRSDPAVRRRMADDYREFFEKHCPDSFKMPMFLNSPDTPLSLRDEYFGWLDHRYGGLQQVNRKYCDNAQTWEELGLPQDNINRLPDKSLRISDWREFIESRSPERVTLYNPNADFLAYLQTVKLPPKLTVAGLDGRPRSPTAITWDEAETGRLPRQLRTEFLTARAWGRFLRVNTSLAKDAWREFLASRHEDPRMPLTESVPQDARTAAVWGLFTQTACPPDALALDRPEAYWREFLRSKYESVDAVNAAYDTEYTGFAQIQVPYAQFHAETFLTHSSTMRKDYLSYNFGSVLRFVTIHGNAAIVTVVYIFLLLATTLTVNPLAAYALARFRLKENSQVLVFLLATMAFPGEVLMIPGFLLVKEFPLLQVGVVFASLLAFALLQMKMRRRVNPLASAAAALIITGILAGWLVPRAAQAVGMPTSVSLLNTFWALVLPGLANGFGIFLLKGFFDSLPPELYEAGLIDGASELRMFWQITLPLCKPILAVMALGAFTAGYGAFMHAFLVCQDPRMWTLMVFLYEFQQTHAIPMVMASLVLAAVPTLLVFIFCQHIILRGIVIPTFK